MGGCVSRTLKQIAGDVEDILREAAKEMLRKRFGKVIKAYHLLEYLESLADAEFENVFGYTGDPHKAKTASLAESHDPRSFPASDYCMILGTENLTDAIGDYVAQGLASVGIAKWMKDKASSDLAAIAGKYLSYPADNDWHFVTVSEQYDAANTDEDSYKLDLSVVYSNATRTECATEVTVHVLYFAGVYYTVPSPKATTFAALQRDAYLAVETLPGVHQGVCDDNALASVLEGYESPIWRAKYNYDFASGKPADITKDASEPILARNSYLAFFPQRAGLTDETIESFIRLHITSGFGLPTGAELDWTTLITADIKAEFRAIIDSPSSNTWNNVNFTKSYGLQKASVRPLKLNALVCAWYGSQTISVNNQDVLVEMIYLYFQGVVYEVQEDPLLQDMKHVIVRNIPGDLGMLPEKITAPKLQGYIRDWNLKNFQRKFDFAYPTTPSTDPHVNHWQGCFEFPRWSSDDEDYARAVEYQIFGPDDSQDAQIHHGLQKPVYEYLVKWFTTYAHGSYAKDDNEWYDQARTNSFPYKVREDNWDLDISASFAYCAATMVEDGRGDYPTHYFYLDLLVYASTKKDTMSSGEV